MIDRGDRLGVRRGIARTAEEKKIFESQRIFVICVRRDIRESLFATVVAEAFSTAAR
jgi:hypothetical protein